MASSNAPGISVPSGAIDQFRALLRQLDRVHDAIELSKKEGYKITLFPLFRFLSEKMNVPHSEIEDAIYALENIRQLTEQSASPEEALNRIEAAVPEDLSTPLKQNREKIIKLFAEFNTDNPLLI